MANNSFSQFIMSGYYDHLKSNACFTPDSKILVLSSTGLDGGRLFGRFFSTNRIYNLTTGAIISDNEPNEHVIALNSEGTERLSGVVDYNGNLTIAITNQKTKERILITPNVIGVVNLKVFSTKDFSGIVIQDGSRYYTYDRIANKRKTISLKKPFNLSANDLKYVTLYEYDYKDGMPVNFKQYLKKINSLEEPFLFNSSVSDFHVPVISSDQRKLILRTKDSLIVRNTNDKKLIYSTPLPFNQAVTISHDDKYILTGMGDIDNSVGVWTIEGDKVEFLKQIKNVANDPDRILLSNDNKFMYINSKINKSYDIWDFNKLIDKIEVPNKSNLYLPPFLSVESSSISFKDANANGLLDANENAAITFKVKNSGKGRAEGLGVVVRSIKPNSTIEIKPQSINALEAGSSKEVTLNVFATNNVPSQLNTYSITVTEPNGLDCQPIEISFNSLKFQEPKLIISEGIVSSGDGSLLKLNAPASLEISVVNEGVGIAENVDIKLLIPGEVLLLNKPFEKIKLKPGESAKVKFDFIVTSRFQGNEVKIKITTTEQFLKYGSTKDISLKVNEPLSIARFTVAQTVEPSQTKQVITTKSINSEPAPALESNPVFYALLIGISDYRNSNSSLGDLDKPVEDASLIYKTLTDSYTFDKDRVYLLKNATRTEIIDMMENLSKKITPKDNLLIFYAGHGHWDEKLKIGYWLPSDAEGDRKSTWLSNSNIKDYIAGINSKHSLLVTDACFSGSIFKSRSVSSLNSYSVSKLYSSPSRKAMTSGNLTTVPDKSKFIEYINKALADNKDKYFSVGQLYSTIYTPILNNSSTVPLYGVMQDTGDEGGEFIFIKK